MFKGIAQSAAKFVSETLKVADLNWSTKAAKDQSILQIQTSH